MVFIMLFYNVCLFFLASLMALVWAERWDTNFLNKIDICCPYLAHQFYFIHWAFSWNLVKEQVGVLHALKISLCQ